MNRELFRIAYDLAADIEHAESDADIVVMIYEALEDQEDAAASDYPLSAAMQQELDDFFDSEMSLDDIEEQLEMFDEQYEDPYERPSIPGSTRKYPDGPSR